MSLPPKYQPSCDWGSQAPNLSVDPSVPTTRELEDELTHAFQFIGLDASSFIETLRNKPTDFLTDERPGVQRLAQLYQSMIPPPTTEDRISRLEIMGEQLLARLEIMGEQLSRPRFAVRILSDEGDTSETTTLPRFVSHSLRCGNHYITTMRDNAVHMPPNPVVALLLPPLSECVPGAEIRFSCSEKTCVVPAMGDKVRPQIPTPNKPSPHLGCLLMKPTVSFMTLVAVPQLCTWMEEGSDTTATQHAYSANLSLHSFGKGYLNNSPQVEFFLSKTQSENWPVSWDAESSALCEL